MWRANSSPSSKFRIAPVECSRTQLSAALGETKKLECVQKASLTLQAPRAGTTTDRTVSGGFTSDVPREETPSEMVRPVAAHAEVTNAVRSSSNAKANVSRAHQVKSFLPSISN